MPSKTETQDSNREYTGRLLQIVVMSMIPKTKISCNNRYVIQARIHTGFQPFTEISQIFHNKYIFNKIKTLSKLNSGQYPVQMTRKPMQERGPKGVKNPKTPLGEPAAGTSRRGSQWG